MPLKKVRRPADDENAHALEFYRAVGATGSPVTFAFSQNPTVDRGARVTPLHPGEDHQGRRAVGARCLPCSGKSMNAVD